jgi:hypothetical protein
MQRSDGISQSDKTIKIGFMEHLPNDSDCGILRTEKNKGASSRVQSVNDRS